MSSSEDAGQRPTVWLSPCGSSLLCATTLSSRGYWPQASTVHLTRRQLPWTNALVNAERLGKIDTTDFGISRRVMTMRG